MATNIIVARGGVEYVPPISLAFWRWLTVFLILFPFFLNEISIKSPKVFLEVGVFHGVTARNVCELLQKIHGNDFKYVGVDSVSYTHLTLPTILRV